MYTFNRALSNKEINNLFWYGEPRPSRAKVFAIWLVRRLGVWNGHEITNPYGAHWRAMLSHKLEVAAWKISSLLGLR